MHEKSRMANALRLLAASLGLLNPAHVFCKGMRILSGVRSFVKRSVVLAVAFFGV